MTAEQREEQMVNRVYGNIHIEYPDVTRELVRERLRARQREMAMRQFVIVDPATADEVYDVLAEECGAMECGRFDFCLSQTTAHPREYRFIGALGFGGKFWTYDGRWYVNCYPEDETPERLAMIERANARLDVLIRDTREICNDISKMYREV